MTTENTPAFVIETLTAPFADGDVQDLVRLLIDAVQSGAAVSFVLPLTVDKAQQWWRQTLAALPIRGVVLVARAGGRIVGSVQMQPAWAPNQPHRAEVVKLLVHRECRRAGLGASLMRAVEDSARRAGFRLLTLDAKEGGAAVHLYRRLGWTEVGTIPRFAVDPDGATLHGTVIFYKEP